MPELMVWDFNGLPAPRQEAAKGAHTLAALIVNELARYE
jgi:hypothetical protein